MAAVAFTAGPSSWLESAEGRTAIRGTCTIGRTTANDLALADDKVSRRHAMIHVQSQGECWLVDLGSANGTYLNDRRVTQPIRLADGDRLSVARHQFVFRSATPVTAASRESPSDTIQEVRAQHCWLLLVDIENSTQFLQRLTENEVPRVTGRWLAACKQVVDENKGSINKFLGDGFFAYWMDGDGTSGDVARALRALRELQAQESPRFRIALHYGSVSIGGGASLGEESLMGSQVNFAFRIEKLAGAIGAPCLISESACAALAALLPTQAIGWHPVPGFSEKHLFHAPQ